MIDIDAARDNWLIAGAEAYDRSHMSDQDLYNELNERDRETVDYYIIDFQNKDIWNEGFNLLDRKELEKALEHLEDHQDKYLHQALVEAGYARN